MTQIMKDLEQYRLENGLTQLQLAERLGVKFVTVSRWLNGHHKPKPIQEYRIKKLLGVLK